MTSIKTVCGLIVLLLILVFAAGWIWHERQLQMDKLQLAEKRITELLRQQETNAAIDAQYAAAQRALTEEANQTRKEVIHYVTPVDNQRCTINIGTLRVLNRAAGEVSIAAGEPDAAASAP